MDFHSCFLNTTAELNSIKRDLITKSISYLALHKEKKNATLYYRQK